MRGLLIAGTAVVLTGEALNTTRQAVLIAVRSRRLNGLPPSTGYAAILDAINCAMTAEGQTVSTASPSEDSVPHDAPTVPLADAARRLGYSRRHARRLAPLLGGRKVAGRWLVDAQAVTEHTEGHHAWIDTP